MIKDQITYEDFEKVDVKVGKVIKVEDFPEARKPAYKLWIDFGKEIGVKTSSAQLVKNQTKEELLNKQVAPAWLILRRGKLALLCRKF